MIEGTLCIVRGGGDLATGVVHRLQRAGLRVIVLELEQPRAVRRMASVAQAMYAGEIQIEELKARRVALAEALSMDGAVIPVLADPEGVAISRLRPAVVVDARMAKAPLDTRTATAPFVVGLGPGFVAGEHCHAVVETHRGHDLGRVLWRGTAQPDTGEPEPVMGYRGERVLRAPAAGLLSTRMQIGAIVAAGQAIAFVDDKPVIAPFAGVLRGLLHHGLPVRAGEKLGDLDPRGQARYCFSISDKALAIGGGVVEAVLTWLRTR